jgi:hypothetical protein
MEIHVGILAIGHKRAAGLAPWQIRRACDFIA